MLLNSLNLFDQQIYEMSTGFEQYFTRKKYIKWHFQQPVILDDNKKNRVKKVLELMTLFFVTYLFQEC